MKSAKSNVKKLVKKTFEKHSVSRITPQALKDIIKSEGYIVSDFSTLTPINQSERFMDGLGISHYADYYDSFTYSDRTVRIVFVRKDVSESEYLYLLALELGRILTHEDNTGNVIGLSTADTARASEFAYHVRDLSGHGAVYNTLKYYTARSTAGISAVAAGLFMLISSFLPTQTPTTVENSIYSDSYAVEAFAFADGENSGELTDIFHFAAPYTPDISADTENSTAEEEQCSFIVSKDNRVYYATKSGKKYHIAGCSYIKGKETVPLTASDISDGSYTPCSRCFK